MPLREEKGNTENKARRFVPLHQKITLRVALLLFGVSLSLGWFGYFLYRGECLRHVGKKAEAMAMTAAAAVMGEDREMPPANDIAALLAGIGKAGEADNLYCLGPRAGDKYPFLASSDPAAPPGHSLPVDRFAPELGQVFVERRPLRSAPRHDENGGGTVSGFAPVFVGDGRIAAVVGVDLPLRDAYAAARSFGLKILSAALGLSLIASWFVLRSARRRLGASIGEMTRLTARIADGELVLPDLPERNDEIGLLGHHIRRVAEAVNLITAGANRLSRERDPDASMVFSAAGLTGKYLEVAKGINKAMTIMDGIDSLIYVADPASRRLLYFNRKFAALFGVDSASARDKKCWEIVGDGSGPCPFCAIDKLRETEGDSPCVEWELFEERAGIWLWVKDSLIPWVDGGNVYLSEARDISVRKEYEKECARQEAAARDAARIALDASEMKSTFLATMSHEIRTPMNGIIGFADLAEDDPAVPAATRAYLGKIKLSAQALLAILDDILDIARIESGDLALESIPFRIGDVFDVLRTICQPQADEKGLTLRFETEPFAGKLLVGDPVRLRRILLCFLTNALKFTERGGVAARAVVEETGEDYAALRFEVEDSGIGMTPEEKRVIFEPFIQADGSVTRKYGGVGVGLSIAKSLIEGMGGTLEVDSAPGEGSRFWFRLSLATVEAPAETAESKAGDNPYRTRKPIFRGRVLVCEDNNINQEVIAEHLSRVGLEAVIAENGREGVAAAAAARREGRPFDLVFMDIHMPVMGGLEATKALAGAGETMPIVALTANVMPHDREQYKKCGMAEVLGKPFKAHELWCCLARYFVPVDHVPLPAAADAEAAAEGGAGSGVVDRRLGLERSANNTALYERLLEKFLKANRDAVPRLRAALDAGDREGAHRLAHSLKSALGMVGAEAASALAREVEAALAADDVGAARNKLVGLAGGMEAVLRELAGGPEPAATARSGGEDEAPGELDPAAALALLDELLPLLRSGQSDCMELLGAIRKNLSPLGADCAMLVEQMEEYDFDPAYETATRMRAQAEACHGGTAVERSHRG